MALVATDIAVFVPVLKDTNGKPIAAVLGTLAFDSVYVADGEAITVGNMREVLGMLIAPFGDWNFQYDVANKKVKAFLNSTGIEAGAIDLSSVTATPYFAWGNP